MTAVKRTLDRALQWACIVLFALLVVIVVWQVVSRLLGSPSSWTEEAARYTFVWLGFFGSALVFSEKGHIAVDFLVRKLSPSGQRATAVLAQISILALALLVLVWGGIRVSSGAWTQELSSLPTQVGVMYTVMPITGAIITVYALYHLIQLARGDEDPYPDEADVIGGDTVTPAEENL